MLAASTAHASDPLGGQSIAVPTAPAAVQNAVAPAVTTVRHTAATVRHTAERSAAAVAPAAPVADVAATADHVVTPVVEPTVQTSPKPAASPRHQPRHRRGGGAAAHAALAHPASAAERAPKHRSTVAKPALPVDAATPEHSAAQRVAAPHRTTRDGVAAPVPAPAPEPATTSTTTASAAGSSGGAVAALALLALLTLASPRLGALLRLAKGWAPMPPLLATPERPG